MPAPNNPKIYHIVHVDNLASISTDGALMSDSVMENRKDGKVIGMSSIKARRLMLPVRCHQGTTVGQYVPFYFCSRSVMLYVIHCANHPELSYTGGQGPIVHLEADLHRTVAWAQQNQHRWAFSLSNAGANYTEFRCNLEQIDEVNWDAVSAHDFRPADIKEGKQAEFLVETSFPWNLVERIGVCSQETVRQTAQALNNSPHRPAIQIMPHWYY